MQMLVKKQIWKVENWKIFGPDPRTIMTLGISCQEDQPGPFRFEIEYIKAVKEVADDTERYRRRLMRYGDGTTNDTLIDNIRKKLKWTYLNIRNYGVRTMCVNVISIYLSLRIIKFIF